MWTMMCRSLHRFRKMVVIGSPLGSVTLSVMSSWLARFRGQNRPEMTWSSIKQLLVIPTALVLPLHTRGYLATLVLVVVCKHCICVRLLACCLPWQLEKHLLVLWELVVREGASRSVPGGPFKSDVWSVWCLQTQSLSLSSGRQPKVTK